MTDDAKDLLEIHDDLIKRKQENLDALNEVRHSVSQARASAKATKRYSDPHWYAKRTAEIRNRGQLDQKLAGELRSIKTELHKQYRHANKRRQLADCFIDVAQSRLPREVYDQLLAAARVLFAIWEQEQLGEAQKLEAEERFWNGYLRTADQKSPVYDRPVNKQALGMLNRQKRG